MELCALALIKGGTELSSTPRGCVRVKAERHREVWLLGRYQETQWVEGCP